MMSQLQKLLKKVRIRWFYFKRDDLFGASDFRRYHKPWCFHPNELDGPMVHPSVEQVEMRNEALKKEWAEFHEKYGRYAFTGKCFHLLRRFSRLYGSSYMELRDQWYNLDNETKKEVIMEADMEFR